MSAETSTGAWIRRQRHLADMTQQEFAALVGVSSRTLIRWERGEISPQGRGAVRLWRALDGLPSASTDDDAHFAAFMAHLGGDA